MAIKRSGRPAVAKGELLCPFRQGIVRRLKTDPTWRAGIRARDLQDEYQVSAARAQKILNSLVENGHVDRVLERIAGLGGRYARFFAPEHKMHAIEASVVSVREAKGYAARVKAAKNRERRQQMRAAAREELAATPPAPPKPPAPEYVGEVVPCRDKVWSQPVEPAGFVELGFGRYLPGESWVTRAFGSKFVSFSRYARQESTHDQ